MIKYKFFILSIFLALTGSVSAQEVTPLKDMPIHVSSSNGNQKNLILYVSGDGGWNDFSKGLVKECEAKGFSVVALDSRKYFWEEKTPAQFTKDVEMLLTHYLQFWNKPSFSIIGYSFGADVSAFIPKRLSLNLRKKTKLLILISPSSSTDFKIKLNDLFFSNDARNRKYKLIKELEQSSVNLLCVFGKEENLLLKENIQPNAGLLVKEFPGSHTYNNDQESLVKFIVGKIALAESK